MLVFFLFFLTTDTRLCSSRPCAGNATCIETGEGGYLCICPHSYGGENCHLKRGLCLTNGYQHLLFEFLFLVSEYSNALQPYLYLFIIRSNNPMLYSLISICLSLGAIINSCQGSQSNHPTLWLVIMYCSS